MKAVKIVLILIVVFLFGCQDKEAIELQGKLKKTEEKLETANNQIMQRDLSNADLEKRIEKLTIENKRLKDKNLQAYTCWQANFWIKDIVKGYGPCVWSYGTDERPIPYERVKNGTPEMLIQKLNAIFKEKSFGPEATFLKVEKGTAYVKIEDSEELTQTMGSTGATAYMHSLAYTLYSVPSVKCVDLEFEVGDHGSPGKRCLEKELKS